MSFRAAKFVNLSLAIGVTALSFLAGEWVLRLSPVSDRMGWNLVAPVAERVKRLGLKKAGSVRVLALGDSFAEWRDTTNGNLLRVAELHLKTLGRRIELVNLAKAGTDLPNYFENLKLYGTAVDADLLVIALYMGNDLKPIRESETSDPDSVTNAMDGPEVGTSLIMRLKAFLKRSIAINYIYRLLKRNVVVLQSGFLADIIARLQAQTGRDDVYVARRLSKADPDLVALARGDAINPWNLAMAMFYPDYYADLANGCDWARERVDPRGQLEGLETLLIRSQESHRRVALILIPPAPWVSERYRGYFQRLGYGRLGPLDDEPICNMVIKDLAAQQDIAVLDLLPLLRKSDEGIFIPNDIHFNRRGQQIAGEALARFLLETDLIEPQNKN